MSGVYMCEMLKSREISLSATLLSYLSRFTPVLSFKINPENMQTVHF